MTRFVAVDGITYKDTRGKERAVEPGAVVPAEVVDQAPWLLEGGHVVASGSVNESEAPTMTEPIIDAAIEA